MEELILDGNAAAGLLREVFAGEMTACPAECANCGNLAEIGALIAFTQAPGIVLRCPMCHEVMLRLVETPAAIYFEARGTVYIRITR